MKVDYSVECALPYTEDLARESDKFALAFNGLAKRIEKNGKQYARVLLVDDVTNDGGLGYDLNAYTDASTGSGRDTLVMRESMLNGLSESIYGEMASRFSADQLADMKQEQGFSSPFYIAIWTLLRLGYVTHPDFPADKVSEKIINVLPESFRKGEEKSMDIVRKTKFPQAAEQVEYVFVED